MALATCEEVKNDFDALQRRAFECDVVILLNVDYDGGERKRLARVKKGLRALRRMKTFCGRKIVRMRDGSRHVPCTLAGLKRPLSASSCKSCIRVIQCTTRRRGMVLPCFSEPVAQLCLDFANMIE